MNGRWPGICFEGSTATSRIQCIKEAFIAGLFGNESRRLLFTWRLVQQNKACSLDLFGLSWFVMCPLWPSWSYPIPSWFIKQPNTTSLQIVWSRITKASPFADDLRTSCMAKRQLVRKLHMPQPTRKWRALPERKRPSTISWPIWKDIKHHQNMSKHILVRCEDRKRMAKVFFFHVILCQVWIDPMGGTTYFKLLCRCQAWIPKCWLPSPNIQQRRRDRLVH